MVIHTAQRLDASVRLRKHTLVPETPTKRLTVAVAPVKEAAQAPELWMQGPVRDPSVAPQGLPHLRERHLCQIEAQLILQETGAGGSHECCGQELKALLHTKQTPSMPSVS